MISSRVLSDVYSLKYPKMDLDKLNNFLLFIKNQLANLDIDIYLFGSYAKGRIRDGSDFDIVLISRGKIDLKQLHKIKINLILDIDDKLDLHYGDDFDIKIYTKDKFEQCLRQSSFFETSINSYMYKII
ncbi:MAG: nucleotidyltransferase domain-containing protein [Terrisporobacter sp.]|uniref:nucleotidyltransferase domain-containing protein n=1 Tax=Terrisporobacter sp. TaxID=1965305 RepID=UPI002FCB5D14